jgi:hypothetical protein
MKQNMIPAVLPHNLHAVDLANPVNRDCPLNAGLAFWWLGLPATAGGGRAWDLSGHGGHGTLENMEAGDWLVSPYGGFCLRFGGSDEYVSCPNWTTADFTFAVCAAIQDPSSGDSGFCGNYDGGDNGSLQFWSDLQAGHGRVGLGVYQSNWKVQYGSTQLDSAWHVYTWTHEAGTHNAYIDGVPEITGWSQTVSALARPFYFGAVGTIGGVAKPFVGEVAWVRRYSRALPPTEVAALYVDTLSGFSETLNRIIRCFPAAVAGPSPGDRIPWHLMIGRAA